MKHYDDQPMTPDRLLDRREFLGSMGTGLGSIALACMLAEEAAAVGNRQSAVGISQSAIRNPQSAIGAHFPPKARRVIQIFCPGAASHIDLWEHKPELQRRHGQPMPGTTAVSSF